MPNCRSLLFLLFFLACLTNTVTVSVACYQTGSNTYNRSYTGSDPTGPFNVTYQYQNPYACASNQNYTIVTNCISECTGCSVTVSYSNGQQEYFCSASARGKQFLLALDTYYYRSNRMVSRKTNYDWCQCPSFSKPGYTGNEVFHNCYRCGNYQTCSVFNGGPFKHSTVPNNETFCFMQEIEEYYQKTHFICSSQCEECLIVAVSKAGEQYGACYQRALGDQFWKPLNQSYSRIDPKGAETFNWCGCNRTISNSEESGLREGAAEVIVLTLFIFLFLVGIVILCCIMQKMEAKKKQHQHDALPVEMKYVDE